MEEAKSQDVLIGVNIARPHNGKGIDQIIVPQEFNSILDIHNGEVPYFVTYSKGDRSICRWTEEGDRFFETKDDDLTLQQHDMHCKLKLKHCDTRGDELQQFDIKLSILRKKMFLFYYYYEYYNQEDHDFGLSLGLIDLNGNEGRSLRLKETHIGVKSIGILPNGDLIIVSLVDEHCEIYKYSFISKPIADEPWKYSQKYLIHDIEIPKKLKEHRINGCFVYQTELFLFDKYGFTQWNLLNMTLEKQYLLEEDIDVHSPNNIVINKNRTLLALNYKKLIIFSMGSGMRVSDCDRGYNPVEFVTLEDGHEGLIVNKLNKCENEDENYEYKFLDPYLLSDAADITDVIKNPFKNIITKSNRKFSIADENENNVRVTNGLKEDTFQQMLNNTYHSNIYTLPIFKTIQNMLENVMEKICDISDDGDELSDRKLFRFTIYRKKFSGFKESQIYSQKIVHIQSTATYTDMIFLYKQLNNQDLALITSKGILIYTIEEKVDNGEHSYFPKLKYFWNNKEWNNFYNRYYKKPIHKRDTNIANDDANDHKPSASDRESHILKDRKSLIQDILDNEFKDSTSSSLPSPNFVTIFNDHDDKNYNLYEELVSNIINNPVEFSEFGSEILQALINKKADIKEDSIYQKEDKIVHSIFDKFTELTENSSLAERCLLEFLGLTLPELCDHHYSDLVTKYILHASFILDPSCSSIKYSTNTSLYTYSKDILIKELIPSSNSYFQSFKSLSLSSYEKIIYYSKYLGGYEKIIPKTPVISFIIPFPKICKYRKYQDDGNYNSWNEMLYKPKSILFCNVDSENFYSWWNFAAIIDFKWKMFGQTYYRWIWFFYTIFFLCFASASTLDITSFYRKILFIISIILGSIHLSFEIRQFLWKTNVYFYDIWNLFDIGAFLLPIITSVYWLANGELLLWITTMSNLLLNLKFLLFFRIHKSFGIYFAIMIGVAKQVFPFLVVLFFLILGFAHAFFIALKPTKPFSPNNPAFDDDENNPWNLATKYNSVNNGTISNITLIQSPDSNTNMFTWFPTSVLSMYLLLKGDSGPLSPWTYHEDPLMTTLLFLFTFFTVIYLMNLFIGLLNMEIEKCNKNEEFLLQRAQFIIEIELFYMFPLQRNNKEWFPDWIYYDIPANEVRKLIDAIDNNKTEFNIFDVTPFISKKLRAAVGVLKPVKSIDEFKKYMEGEFKKHMEDEFKKYMEDEFKEYTEDKFNHLNVNNNNNSGKVIDEVKKYMEVYKFYGR